MSALTELYVPSLHSLEQSTALLAIVPRLTTLWLGGNSINYEVLRHLNPNHIRKLAFPGTLPEHLTDCLSPQVAAKIEILFCFQMNDISPEYMQFMCARLSSVVKLDLGYSMFRVSIT